MQILGNLRTRLIGLLPLLIVMFALMGIGLLAVRSIVPGWQRYEELSNAIGGQRAQIDQRNAEANDANNIVILERQIAAAREAFGLAALVFLADSEVERVIDAVYSNAYARAVQVINLQIQQPDEGQETPGYDVSVIQVQIQGPMDDLIEYVSRMREASLTSIQIQGLRAAAASEGDILTLTLLVYSSEYAPGSVLDQFLQEYPLVPTLSPSPTPTSTPEALTSEAAVTQQPAVVVPSPVPTLDMALLPTAVVQSASVRAEPCDGAPTSLFKVGDIAVVDFDEVGALRVLADPHGSVRTTRTQAYDNHRLEILAGPVCAQQTYYWYVRNLTQGGALGWVAEASGADRWLCPEDDLECA